MAITSLNMQKALVSFAGNHLGDNTRTGNIFDWQADQFNAGTPPVLTGNSVVASGSPGVLTAPVGWMYFSPIVEPGVTPGTGANASLVVQQTVAAAGALPLVGIASGIPYSKYRIAMVNGVAMIQLDVPRSILLAVIGTVGNRSTAFNFYVSGADFWGQPLTVQKAVASNISNSTFYDLPKSFKYVQNITVDAGTGCPIWVGVGGIFGMDYYTPSKAFLTRMTYNNAFIDIDAATRFNAPPLLTATPTATANDVRGSVMPVTLNTSSGAGLVSGAFLSVQYIIEGGTAQTANTYTLASNTWSATSNNTRVLHTLGAPQFYDPNLA